MAEHIKLTLKDQPSLPVEAENIRPDFLQGKSLTDIKNITMWNGNKQRKLGELFEVEMENDNDSQSDSCRITIKGDLTRFKRLGEGMTSGELFIDGSAGFHTGALMKGGSLVVKGSCGDWLGAQMAGGRIVVEGSAGHSVGSAYRGNIKGMMGGLILIQGDAGQRTGSRMRRGIIAISGDCGDFAGYNMLAGTIIIGGDHGIRAGANMIRGTIILFKPGELLPTFYYNCTYRFPMWGLLWQELNRQGFELAESYRDMVFERYSGDGNTGAKGEILKCL